jgi:hypothetical protein
MYICVHIRIHTQAETQSLCLRVGIGRLQEMEICFKPNTERVLCCRIEFETYIPAKMERKLTVFHAISRFIIVLK